MPPRALSAFSPLSRAEARLVETLDVGDFDRIAAGGAPRGPDPDLTVRAALLRFLILGGPETPRLHEKGLRLSGAWIAGPLDLEGCRIPRDIGLADCAFDAAPVLRSAVIDTLILDGSVLPGLIADGLEARGGVYLRGARVTGQVRLEGARLGGALALDGAEIAHPEDVALEAGRIEARGGVQLRGAVIRGGATLTGARIEAGLDALGAKILRPGGAALTADGMSTRGDASLRLAVVEGATSLTGARIGGDLDLSGGAFIDAEGIAVRLKRIAVDGAFFLRDGARVEGALSLNGARLGAIVDDPESWPPPGGLLLNQCVYGAFLGSRTDAAARLEWLGRQAPHRWDEDFWPQPYEQLAAVLYEIGHDEDARVVLFAKERRQRRARRARAKTTFKRGLLWTADGFLRLTVGYGRRPLRAFLWLGLLWAGGTAMFAAVEADAALRPNVAVTLRSPEWLLCAAPTTEARFLPSLGATRAGLAAPGQAQMDCFLAQPEAASYPPFNALMYALDALVPALETGPRAYWAPDTRRPWGYAAKTLEYVLTIAGWGLSLLAVAGFSGLVKSR